MCVWKKSQHIRLKIYEKIKCLPSAQILKIVEIWDPFKLCAFPRKSLISSKRWFQVLFLSNWINRKIKNRCQITHPWVEYNRILSISFGMSPHFRFHSHENNRNLAWLHKRVLVHQIIFKRKKKYFVVHFWLQPHLFLCHSV